MTTEERRGALKEALIAAGIQTIETRGLRALRARDLAKAVGCSLGSIYIVFPDLDTLILSINLSTMALMEAHLAGVVKPLPPDHSPKARDAAREQLVALSLSYLEFAAANLLRWRAIFEHRLELLEHPPEVRQAAPDWYTEEIGKLFAFIETPVRVMRPDLDAEESALLARSLFSAAHGMVALGLEDKITTVPIAHLADQLRIVVNAMARGLMVDNG
ncbi:MAG: TetR/AcrR family transcriptional regulator [Methylobacteriaceae bacterium]|jgi:AcrR family transcriptional regulator|nr:TetR/AcrR family transcriptional regulator [Methylobacteriaceae bacterium]